VQLPPAMLTERARAGGLTWQAAKV